MLVWRLTLYQKRGGNALFAATSRRIKVFEQKTGGVFDTTFDSGRRDTMKKKTIIAFFCATFSVCAIYGGLRYTVSSGTSQVTMADTLEEDIHLYHC